MPAPFGNPSRKDHGRRWLAVSVSLVLLGGIALPGLFVISDEGPPDIAAFGPPPPAVGPDVTCFNQAIAKVVGKMPRQLADKYPPELLARVHAEIQDMIDGKRERHFVSISGDYPVIEMVAGYRWDQDVAGILLQTAAAAGLWQALDEALTAPDDPSFGWGDNKFGSLSRLSSWLTIRLRDELNKGDSAAALQSLRRLFLLGKKLEQNASTFQDWLVSLNICSETCRLTGKILPELHAPPGVLCSLAAEIGRFRPETENARTAFRGEIVFINRQKDAIWPDRKHKGMAGLWDNIIFKKNQTARLLGECIQDTLRLFARDAGNYAVIKPRVAAMKKSWEVRVERGRKYIINKDGWRVVESMNGFYEVISFHVARSMHSLAQAALALRTWQAGHGVLPDTLDALVPACLPSVPIDYMDGNPIRYWQETGELWTIRRDDLPPGDDDTEYTLRLPPR
ncbi:MAG: hypothetical protein LBK99_12265 [Opitutaceae bacterium]|jgi:hypothetical protein|nr:hypothetical protein [Opitutaceae bacterium]